MQAESKEIAVAVEPRCGVEDFECFQIGIRQSDALETLGSRADQTKVPRNQVRSPSWSRPA